MNIVKDIFARLKRTEKPMPDKIERRLNALKGARLAQHQQWLLFKNQPSHSAA